MPIGSLTRSRLRYRILCCLFLASTSVLLTAYIASNWLYAGVFTRLGGLLIYDRDVKVYWGYVPPQRRTGLSALWHGQPNMNPPFYEGFVGWISDEGYDREFCLDCGNIETRELKFAHCNRYNLVAIWPIVLAASFICWKKSKRHVTGCCCNCGYNLTGNVSGVCPECETPVPPPVKPATAESISA